MTTQAERTAQNETFDPVSLEVMWSRLINIADEMWTTVLRTAVSTIIGAAQDFGCELLDQHGNSLAHSYRSMPVFNLIMPELTRKLLETYPVFVALALVGLVEPGIVIRNPGTVSKTWPGYFDMLAAL